MNFQSKLLVSALCFWSFTALASGAPTTWNFVNPDDRLAASSGSGALSFYDPNATGWAMAGVQFGSASSLGLPLPGGADTEVMGFPKAAADQGFNIAHGFAANGAYGDTLGLTSNYTIVMDVLFPASSDATWRNLMQTDPANTDDGELFVNPGNGIGINNNYVGEIQPDTWHRIVWAVRAAPGEGQAHRYIDGQFAGAIGTTGSGLEERWALVSDFLMFTDENDETNAGYVSSISIVDRKLTYDEAVALGGVNAAGADTAGAPAAPLAPLMPRVVGTLGHRGSSGCAPENTLVAIGQAFTDGAAGTEIDTRITSDGVVVAFHDATVDRTTDGVGDIVGMTLAEVKALDAGSWFDPSFAGERVPTLEEVLADSKGKGIIYLDIKTGGQAQGFADAVNASGFPLEDLWFWTPGNAAYAAEIRALLPDAKILWGGPEADWRTNPNYFEDLKEIGVIGFSYGQGAADLEFSAAAKAADMVVEVFTILTPEQMIAAAEAGVDYIETDFPNVMQAMQPERDAAASGPAPIDGQTDVNGSPVLAWVLADTPQIDGHLVRFGTSDPPPVVSDQSHDLFKSPVLEQSTTYFWRIDTKTPGGVIDGPTWSFTTLAAPDVAAVNEWHLNGSLATVAGDASIAFGGTSETTTAWETSDGATVPHMADGPTGYLRVPAFSDPADGLDLSFLTTGANGGGTEINQYTFAFDVFVPGALDWMSFFNTNPANTNDGDFFIRSGGGLGIAVLGYAADGTISEGTWHRVIFSADLGAGTVSYYVDGQNVLRRTGASLLDGRHSLFGIDDNAGPHVKLFNDNDGEMIEVLVGAIAFLDGTIDDATALELGAPSSAGIFIREQEPEIVDISTDSAAGSATITWKSAPGKEYRVEASATLSDVADWLELSDDAGSGGALSTYTETDIDFDTTPRRFYRVSELD
ncbi:MAG: glycerophosphodiester phosphodiesterase [Verrucomicrobiales bacterium]